jgi:lipopolysaccharide transport system ATP-binding protein
MNDIAIKVENLSKQYRLGKVGTGTLSHDLNRLWHTIRGKEDPYLKIGQTNDRARKADSEYVWALQDINFEVKKGEVIGIIGRNGAGKSTLLKILSKITAPTSGQITINGRIASLLEVGTGFHPELSGRENIFLNGAILGMRKWEIQKKFDEIVDFAGVEAYIDTPVKRYSSGMYVRLAFAVAAFLEPEILIVDEVLAVGDAEFQKKCLGRMQDISDNDGRTVLYVSHNMASLSNLCKNSVLLVNGKINKVGRTDDVISYYLNTSTQNTDNLILRNDRLGNGTLIFTNIKFYQNNKIVNQLISGVETIIELSYKSKENTKGVFPAIGFFSLNGDRKIILYSKLYNFSYDILGGEGYFKCKINRFPLSEGTYKFNLLADADGINLDWIHEAGSINVINGDYFNSGRTLNEIQNIVLVDHEWVKV